jgi:hypothetical protein
MATNCFAAVHCLDIIRQHIQCYGSTTLIPTRYMNEIHRGYIDSDQEHTCRDFNALRKYSTKRWLASVDVRLGSKTVDDLEHVV